MSKPCILIIDDDRTILQLLELALQRADFDVLLATDGNLGLRKFEEEQPDLAVIDIAMPGMDGYAVIERIRASEAARSVEQSLPIIIFSAHDQRVMKTYAEEMDISYYLTKPIKPAELIEYISACLATHRS